ncbi:MAG TPA: hypothetical protein PK883_05255 [Anaerolineaceae bacterium]|nr:hypothetical protein [Anaerolineaceae bacterium]
MSITKNRKSIHFLLWGLMILYLFIAPVIKDRVTIVIGKPVEVEGAQVVDSDRIRSAVNRLSEARVDGQWVYRVQGWSFITDDMDQTNYDIFLVFSNDKNFYFFETTPKKRSDIEEAYPEVEIDLTNSGFDAFIAKETIANGRYEIGMLYRNKTSGEFAYSRMDRTLVKTINDIQMEEAGPE